MPNTSADARQHPSRRTVLKVGANAAWAVPAIQIASATPAFAASQDQSKLTVTVMSASISGANVVATVKVTASSFAAKNVFVTPSGDTTTSSSTSFGPIGSGASVTKTITVARSNATGATGTINFTATGDTNSPGSIKSAIPGVAAYYSTATINLQNSSVTHSFNNRTGTVSFRVTAGAYAGAKIHWTVTPTSGYQAGSSPTTGTVTVAHDGSATVGPLQYIYSNNGTKRFAIAVTGTTDNAGSAATNGDSFAQTSF